MARKSVLAKKMLFVLLAAIFFSTVYYLHSQDTQNVRGNFGAIVVIFVLTMVPVLILKGKYDAQDEINLDPRELSSPRAIKAWYKFQEENRKRYERASKLLESDSTYSEYESNSEENKRRRRMVR